MCKRDISAIVNVSFIFTIVLMSHNHTYLEMSGQKSEVINSRFANQRIFPYIFP